MELHAVVPAVLGELEDGLDRLRGRLGVELELDRPAGRFEA